MHFAIPATAPTIAVADIWQQVVGVRLEEYACPTCGWRPRSDQMPTCYCTAEHNGQRCGHPLPRACETCGEPVEGIEGDRPYPYCDRCLGDSERTRRQDLAKARVPRQYQGAVKAFWEDTRTEHRDPLYRAIVEWSTDLDYGAAGDGRGLPSCLWIWGSAGSGKTVASLLLLTRALVKGRFRDARYVTEAEVIRAAVDQFDDHERDAARALLREVRDIPLLVLDELGRRAPGGHQPYAASRGYTPREHQELTRIVYHRLDQRLPTVCITNRSPDVQTTKGEQVLMHGLWLDETIASRVAGSAWILECSGVDLRRA